MLITRILTALSQKKSTIPIMTPEHCRNTGKACTFVSSDIFLGEFYKRHIIDNSTLRPKG
jgi:hypothetical protein